MSPAVRMPSTWVPLVVNPLLIVIGSPFLMVALSTEPLTICPDSIVPLKREPFVVLPFIKKPLGIEPFPKVPLRPVRVLGALFASRYVKLALENWSPTKRSVVRLPEGRAGFLAGLGDMVPMNSDLVLLKIPPEGLTVPLKTG